MEQYDGLAILATNLRRHLDDAFTRRLQFVVEFPFPDEADRRRIWQVCFPADGAPRRRPSTSSSSPAGSGCRAATSATSCSAPRSWPPRTDARIGMDHLLAATRREYQKMGKVVAEADLQGDPDEPR